MSNTAQVPVPLLSNTANIIEDAVRQLNALENKVLLFSVISDLGHVARALRTEIALASAEKTLAA